MEFVFEKIEREIEEFREKMASYGIYATVLSKLEFINALKLILNSTYFIFNDIFYKQTFEILVDSILSPIVADIVFQNFWNLVLNLSFTRDFSITDTWIDCII